MRYIMWGDILCGEEGKEAVREGRREEGRGRGREGGRIYDMYMI